MDDILEHGYGTAPEVNMLFTALVRAAGYNAQIAQSTTRDNAFFLPSLLDPSQLSSDVVWIGTAAGGLYLDPSVYLCPFGLLPWQETWTRGIRISKFGSEVLNIPAPVSKDAVVERKADLHVGKDGALQGKLEVTFRGQYALGWRRRGHDEDTAGRRKGLQDEVKSWLPAGAKVELSNSIGWEVSEEPLRVEFNVSIPDQAVRTPRRILLPLAPIIAGESNPLPYASRLNPVYFQFPYQELDEIRIEVPAGYEIEAVPKPRKRTGPLASYELTSIKDGNALVAKRRLIVDGFYYEKGFYPALRMFFGEVKADDQDRAVLRVVTTPPSH